MKNRIHAQIIEISGSTEIAPLIGLSDFIADLVSSWATLKANGLRELMEIFVSEWVCAKTCMSLNDEKEVLIKKLVFRMEALLNAQKSKYLVMNAPKEALKKIIKIFPWLESPTVTALWKKWMVSISMVVGEDFFWDDIETLKQVWASGILVMPIEKIVY